MLVTIGTSTNEQFLTSHMGIVSESHCLFGQFCRGILSRTSDPEAGVKTKKSGGIAEEGEYGYDVAGLLVVRERRSYDILPVKKRNEAVCK